MVKIHNHSNGFTAVEALLVFVTLALISVVGYFVAKHVNTKKTMPSTAVIIQTNTTKTTPPTPQADLYASWKLFTSSKLGFSMRIPDGWTLFTDSASDILISGKDTTSITYKSGTIATVTTQTLGDDDIHPFEIAQGLTDQQLASYTKLGVAYGSGITGVKYYYEQTTNPQALGLPKGGKEYRYHFVKNQNIIDVDYSVLPGDANNTAWVEKAVSTLTVN